MRRGDRKLPPQSRAGGQSCTVLLLPCRRAAGHQQSKWILAEKGGEVCNLRDESFARLPVNAKPGGGRAMAAGNVTRYLEARVLESSIESL